MGHCINGTIVAHDHLRIAIAELSGVRLCPLLQGLAFVPATQAAFGSDWVPELPIFCGLPKVMYQWAQKHSHSFPVAYIETDYFGGTGSQSAVIWIRGDIAFGPEETNNETFPAPAAATELDAVISGFCNTLVQSEETKLMSSMPSAWDGNVPTRSGLDVSVNPH